jgi:hypothetical protein
LGQLVDAPVVIYCDNINSILLDAPPSSGLDPRWAQLC